MPNTDTQLGPQDAPDRDHAGTSTDQRAGQQRAGQQADLASGHQGPDQGGHAGHYWMMLLICVPMLLVAITRVATKGDRVRNTPEGYVV